MTQQQMPTRDPVDEPIKEAAKTAGRLLLWIAIVVAVIAVLLGLFLLGPLGLIIVLPALMVIWGAAAVTGAVQPPEPDPSKRVRSARSA